MKVLFLIEAGHGGFNEQGVYVTPGKRSPKFDDGTVLYEGVNNRINVSRILAKAKSIGVNAIDLLGGSNLDVPLRARTNKANELHAKHKCALISIHSDGAAWRYIDKACTVRYDDKIHINIKTFYYKEEWHPAEGISVYTSPGYTPSDPLAEITMKHLKLQFGKDVIWRTDTRDGDMDKEAKFFMLTQTKCPAILIECDFHTNKKQATEMLTDKWRERLSVAVSSAMAEYEKLQ